MNKTEEYIISDTELLEIQKIQRELISEVDRICKDCGIHYNMVGGTMLGAIRHGGYIPWDDDADIGFLRKEYEKFREACKTELNTEKYYMQDIRDTKGYRWGYGKLRRKDTQFLRLHQEEMPYEQGISIDLMPFDNVPDSPMLRKIHCFLCFVLRKCLWSEIGKKQEPKVGVRVLYKIANLIPRKTLVCTYEWLIKSTVNKKTKLVRILTFPTPKKVYGYNREWYTELKRYSFNDLSLPGAKDYDGYLTVKYGDYIKLPPEGKRKVHPISNLILLKENSNGEEKV